MAKILFILGELGDKDIDWIITNSSQDTIPAGTILIQEGKPIDTLYILLEGELSVTTRATGDREIACLTSGEVVGEMSFVDTHPPSATVIAKEKSLVLAIPKSRLAAKLRQDLEFTSRFYRALAIFLSNRLRVTVNQLSASADTHISATDLLTDEQVLAEQLRLDALLERLRGDKSAN